MEEDGNTRRQLSIKEFGWAFHWNKIFLVFIKNLSELTDFCRDEDPRKKSSDPTFIRNNQNTYLYFRQVGNSIL